MTQRQGLTGLLALLLSIQSAFAADAPVTALRIGRLIDGHGGVVRDAVVVVDGERIAKVGAGDAAVPPNATVIDLRRFTAIPGLIDAHTHMSFFWDRSPGSRPWSQLGNLGAAVTVFLAQENARKTLETGVTTVRDLGSWEYTDLALRDLIQRGAMAGPRRGRGQGPSVLEVQRRAGLSRPAEEGESELPGAVEAGEHPASRLPPDRPDSSQLAGGAGGSRGSRNEPLQGRSQAGLQLV